jgi:hypothetical protein
MPPSKDNARGPGRGTPPKVKRINPPQPWARTRKLKLATRDPRKGRGR